MSTRLGMDVLLTQQGKGLQAGESVRFTLIKGPTTTHSKDPVSSKAPLETFPQVAKFSESVVRPDFTQSPWNQGRLYQQDTPKAQDDSDEEQTSSSKPRAKKRWRRHEAPRRQWVLQDQTDFLETMVAKRQKKQHADKNTSTRYEGTSESNPSHFVILSAVAPSKEQNNNEISVIALPPNAVQAFSQPMNRQTLSMTEAEQAIEDQRGKMTRYMMHRGGAGDTSSGGGSKARLMGKLQSKLHGEGEEDDDVMGDVAFKSRKGANKARKELLSSLADEGVTADDEGVLGGTNDAEFGGKSRFGQFKAETDAEKGADDEGSKTEDAAKSGSTAAAKATSYDGQAMSDDFYQRDVKAEYEELDYDANEQFDDDDVDLGEAEVVVDSGGFAADDEDEDEDFLEEEREGAEGLATLAGFRAMLAKARGETVAGPEDAAGTAPEADKKETAIEGETGKRVASPSQSSAAVATEPTPGGALTQVLAAAEKSAQAAKEKAAVADNAKPTGVEVDANGQRVVSLEAIRREIWLQNGSIGMKRLMKIFDIKKKTSKERKDKFMRLVKELCILIKDNVEGNMLVLKQHYSNM